MRASKPSLRGSKKTRAYEEAREIIRENKDLLDKMRSD